MLFGLLSGASGVYSRRGNVTFSRHQTDSSCFHLFQHKLKRLTGNQTSCNLVEQPVRWWSWRALRVPPLSFKTTDVFLENSFTRTPGRSRCSRKSHVKNKQCVCFLFGSWVFPQLLSSSVAPSCVRSKKLSRTLFADPLAALCSVFLLVLRCYQTVM